MRYKRAFFVAFVVLVIGLGLHLYSTNYISSEAEAHRWAGFEWFQYQTLGLIIFSLGVGLFIYFTGIAIKNWIGM